MSSKEIRCESRNSLGTDGRYRAPLRRIYKKLKIEQPNIENSIALLIGVHGIKNTANHRGIIPTLLAFGSVPKIPIENLEHLSPNQRQRFEEIYLSRK